MTCRCEHHSVKLSVLASIGILLGLCGAILYGVFPFVYRDQIAKMFVLEKSNEALYDNWKSPPIPVEFKIYFFNVMNPDDVRANASKPKLNEMGPYVFKETRDKVGIKFSDNEKSVSYRNHKTYTFDPDASSGSLDDYILTINAPYVGIVKKIRYFPLLLKSAFNGVAAFKQEDLLINKTVRELAFDGYQEPLIEFLQRKFGMSILPNATFGFFYQSKISDDGLYKIHTGKDDAQKFAVIEEWENKTKLDYWGTKYCNMLNGTDGSQYPPSVSKLDTLYTYSTDLCRSLHLNYEKEFMHLGITTYRFIAPKNLFAAPDSYPPNKCFCRSEPCFGAGLLDISSCKQGAPVVMSAPHFYQADEIYRDAVIGLNPNKVAHQTLLDVEPATGAVLNGKKRVQINIDVRQSPDSWGMKHADNIIFPVLWVEEGATIDEKSAEKFKDKILKPKAIVFGTVVTLIVVGCLLLVIAITMVAVLRQKKLKRDRDLDGQINYGMNHLSKD